MVSVSLDTTASRTKTADEPIEVSFEMWTRMVKDHVLDGVCGSPHEKNHLGGKCPVLGMLRRVGGRRTQRTGRCSQGGSGDATSATSTVATCYCHHDCWMWLLWRHCPARSLTVPVQGTAYCGLLIISRPYSI